MSWTALLTADVVSLCACTRTHLGAISSIDITMHLVGTAVGPVIATSLRAVLGSYTAVFTLYTLLPLISGTVVLCCARKPQPPDAKHDVP